MTRYRWLILAVALIGIGSLLAFTRLGRPVRAWIANTARDAPASAPRQPGTASAIDSAAADTTPRGDVAIDARRQQLTGVRTEPVTRGSLGQAVRAVGMVRPDETRQAEINTKIDGWIQDLAADYTGKAVRSGDRLFTLYSPSLLTTEREYLLAHRGHAEAARSEIQSVREYSDRLLQAARDRLLLWDLTADDIRELEAQGNATGFVAFRSPMDGVVVEKTAVKGMRVMAGQNLFRIADLSVVWVEADVYERDLASVRVGQPATVTLQAYPGESFNGRTTYIHPTVDEATRTARVRVQLGNRNGRLKPGMYATVDIQGSADDGLSVPANALVDSGTEQVVFVAQGDGYFTPKRVKAGRRLGDRVEIVDGLKQGEQVASSATFFLDSESQLRGGLQNYEPSSVPAGDTSRPASSVDFSFRSLTEPPKTGENEFEVLLKDAAGTPITDADVSVRFFMPAMPTMNMPAMKNEVSLPHIGNGAYRGSALVMMGGSWDVTVTASKGQQLLGRKQLTLVAK